MMSQIQEIIGQILHLLSAIAFLAGAAFLLASLLSMKGPDGYIKGLLLLVLASWMAHPHF